MNLTELRQVAETAAELAANRKHASDRYVDEAMFEEVYAEAVVDVCNWLITGQATDGLTLVLRAGRAVNPDCPRCDGNGFIVFEDGKGASSPATSCPDCERD